MKSFRTLILVSMVLLSPGAMAVNANDVNIITRFSNDLVGFATKNSWAQDVQSYVAFCYQGSNLCPNDEKAIKLGIDLNKFYSRDKKVREKYRDDLQNKMSDAYEEARNLANSATAMVPVMEKASLRGAQKRISKAISDAKRNPKP